VVRYKNKENENNLSRVAESIASYSGIYEISQTGLPSIWLEKLLELLPFSKATLAGLFYLSTKTIERYIKSNAIMNPQMSETTLRIYNLSEKGKEVFGSQDSFNKWLTKPSFPLNNQPPISFLNTGMGITLVMEELERIEYGTLA